MMFSEKSAEGYILIDHKESPGLDRPFANKGQRFEGATNTCSHCDKVVIQNPDRTRARGHCSTCNYFICDSCQAEMYLGGECRCRNKRIDDYFNKLNKELTNGT